MFGCPMMMSGGATGLLDDFESWVGGVYPDNWNGTQRGSVGRGGIAYSGSYSCYIGTGSSGSGTLMSRSFTVSGYNRVRFMMRDLGSGSPQYGSACTMTLNGNNLSYIGATATGINNYYECLYNLPGSGTLNVSFNGYAAVGGSTGQGTGASVAIDHLELVNR